MQDFVESAMELDRRVTTDTVLNTGYNQHPNHC